MAEPKTGFQTPPEVTEYFRRKVVRPGFSYQDVWAEEHAYAFMVAKATELELATTFQRSIDRALTGGQGLDSWQKEILADLGKIGWGGPRLVRDPTGQMPDRMVNFAAPGRLQTIFWGNVASARAAGQWERAQRTKAALPHILYVRTTSGEPRPEHLRWVGVILPIDDPFWTTHWPPNGWRCKCTIRQVSARERDRLLASEPRTERDIRYTAERPETPTRRFVNRRTGEVSEVPEGIDPGWHTNPGLSRARTLMQHLDARLAEAPAGTGNRILEEAWTDPFLRIAPRVPEKIWMPAGVAPELQAELGAVSPVVSIDNATVAAKMAKHKMAADQMALLPRILSEGHVLPDRHGEANVRNVYSKIGKSYWFSAVVRSVAGYLRVRTVHQRGAQRMQKAFQVLGLPWPWIDDIEA